MTNTVSYTILDAAGATGEGKNIFAQDFNIVKFTFDTDGGGDAALTVKFQASDSEDSPDFGAVQSVTNRWEYLQTIDADTGSAINGVTGIAVATADDHRSVEANIGAARWVNAVVTARTAGEVTIGCTLFNNKS